MDRLCTARALSVRFTIRLRCWSLLAILPVLLFSAAPLVAQAPVDKAGAGAASMSDYPLLEVKYYIP